MKIKTILLILALAAVIVPSCQKSSDVCEESGRPSFSIVLNTGRNFTKTPGSDFVGDETGESAISSLRLFLVSDDSSKTIRELTPGDEYRPDEEDPMVLYATLNPEQYVGKWLVYVIANWPENIPLDTSDYDSFIGSYTGLSDAQLASMWNDGHFPMVNVCNAATEDGKLNGGISVELKRKDVALIPVAEVTLERIAAKVSASVDPYVTYGILGTQMGASTAVFGVSRVFVQNVAMINNVRSFNLIQKWTPGGSLVTPSSAADYSIPGGYYNTTVPPAVWNEPGDVMYCLENNSPEYSSCGGSHPDASAGTRMKGRVTGLLIRARVETLSYFKSEADTDPTDGEYGENLIVDPDEGIWTRSSLTKASGSDAAFRTFYKYKGVYFADYQQLFAQNPSLGSTEADAAPSLLRAKGVRVFEDGYMYYTYWIETQGDQYVARNVFYNLSITSINAFGDDVPGGFGYDPSDPIKTEEPRISVSLKIADWDEKPAQNYTL